jgi:transcriptional regulator with XRE-family HTH domain
MAQHIRPKGNIVGSCVRRARSKQGLSQSEFAAKCQRMGWNIGRDILARIEASTRLVTDSELLFLARALEVSVADLFPPTARANSTRPIPQGRAF